TSLIMLSAGTGLVGLTRRTIRVARGTISCNTPSRLAPSSDAMKLMPVIFPPGWLRLATMPAFTGSVPAEKTIGIVVVAAFAARADAVLTHALSEASEAWW